MISYFYNTGQIKVINEFFDNLIDSVVSKRDKSETFIIIVNDVNSCYRGRDHFNDLLNKINTTGVGICSTKRFFEYDIRSVYQRYGLQYESNENKHEVPGNIRVKYMSALYCSSAQLIIEVK